MKKRHRAQMWDRMQFLFRHFYDRMVHLQFCYDGKLDEETLGEAIKFMVDREPTLHSSFHQTIFRPYWREEEYCIDDILSFQIVEDAEKAAGEFLTGRIPLKSNVQLKIAVFEQGEKTVLAIRINHMCMDGPDAKNFVTMLVQNYNHLRAGEKDLLQTKSGDRSHMQIYSKFDKEDRKAALGLFKNIAKCKDKVRFPWTPKSKEDVNRIVRRDIEPERFSVLVAKTKQLGVTVNDALMAMAFRSFYEICGLDRDKSMTVSCAIDLRRHIDGGGMNGGFTNHIAWLACRTMGEGDTMADTLQKVCAEMQKFKEDKFVGLYSLPLLNLGYTIFPQALAEFAIKLGYDNPLLAISNMGVLNAAAFTFDGTTITDGFVSGAVKNKPYFLMSATTMLGKLTLSATTCGTEADEQLLEKFFDIMENNLQEFCAIEK